MRILSLLLLMTLLACGCETDLVTGDAPNETGEATSASDDSADGVFSAMAETAISLVNQQRAAGCDCGGTRMPPVPPLRLDGRLMAAAQAHSNDMAAMRRMQHTGSDGSKVSNRVSQAGFDWTAVAENIAWNQPDVRQVIVAWIESPGHCRNLMNEHYRFMGFGETDLYWTQVFAR